MSQPQYEPPARPDLRGHWAIMRADHWVKNVFVLPGIIGALALAPAGPHPGLWLNLVLGLTAICLIASSYYTLNEILDAPYDRGHPVKCLRPVPAGRVNVRLAYVQWLVLGAVGLALGWSVNQPLGLTLLALWLMGCAYNIPPLRTKDVPYLDVISESVNNPLRLLTGWFIVGTGLVPPLSLLLSYWFVGAYFMAIKRFAELRELGDRARAAAYRRSFAYYTEQRLLTSIMFYGSAAMLFLGAFTMRYRLELVLAYPLVALVMAVYFNLAFMPNSPAQAPENLHREPGLMAAVTLCTVALGILFFVDLPWLHRLFTSSLATPPINLAP
jgi:decaprenyl-phosphate phosphoribosyltransferase